MVTDRRNPRQLAAPRGRALALAATVVAMLAFAAAAAGIPGRATYGAQVSGDEPHYLLTAISLGEDGGLDVSDEIAGQRYRAFHEAGLLRQAATRPGGVRIVPHDPLLPVLLALPVRAGGWIGAKLALAATAAALAALVVWLAVRRFRVRLGVASAVTAVFALSAPLAVYGHQVYPELPAALATTGAVAALTGPMRRGGLTVLTMAVLALPWLAVKYVPVAAVLAVLALLRLWRGFSTAAEPAAGGQERRLGGRERRPSNRQRSAGNWERWSGTPGGHRARWSLPGGSRAACLFVAVLTLAGALYGAAHLAWYGGLTAYASGDFFQAHGGQLSVMGADPHYLGRSRRLVGLLVGSSFGIAAWQPAWLLAVPAAAALVRRRPHGWAALAAPFAGAWLVATFVAVTMQGWWFPGRQVVVVLPLAVVAIAWWIGTGALPAASRRRRPALFAAFGVLGVWSYAALAAQAAAGRLTWIVDFDETADPWYGVWHPLLPDYLDVSTGTWVRHGIWIAILALAAVWAWRRSASVLPVQPLRRPDASAFSGRTADKDRDGS